MNIKEILKKGETLYGTWCLLPSPEVINVIAKSGLDFVFIDMEHGSTDNVNVGRMITSAQVDGCSAIVRVPSINESSILRVLDMKPDGIIVPHVSCKKDSDNFVNYSKYAPIGNRGYSPYTKSGGYSFDKDYTQRENDRLINIVIIEDIEGIKNIDIILMNDNIDVVYIGTYDLSVSLGIPGQVNDARVKELIEYCVNKIKSKNKIVGCLFHTKIDHDYFVELGVQLLVYKVDTSILYDGFSMIKNFK